MSNTATNATPRHIVAELYRLFGEGRIEETFELMSPDVVLQEPGNTRLIPWAGEFHGHDGLRTFYEGLRSALSEIAIDPDSLELTPIDDHRVLALGTERGTSAETGKQYRTHSAWIWSVRDGKIHEVTAFHDTAAMTAALL